MPREEESLATGYIVVKTSFPSWFQPRIAEDHIRGVRDEFPVIYPTVEEAMACFQWLLEGRDLSFYVPNEDHLGVERVIYRNYRRHDAAYSDPVQREHVAGYTYTP